MKKFWCFSAGLIFLVAVTVSAFGQESRQGMMEETQKMGSKEGMAKATGGMEKSDMKSDKNMMEKSMMEKKDVMEEKGAMMEGEMKKEATGMMK